MVLDQSRLNWSWAYGLYFLIACKSRIGSHAWWWRWSPVWPSALLLTVIALIVGALSPWQATRGMVWDYSSGSLLESRFVCCRSKFIYRVRRLSVISSLSCKFQSVVGEVMFGSGISLQFVNIIAFLVVVDCLFRSYPELGWRSEQGLDYLYFSKK